MATALVAGTLAAMIPTAAFAAVGDADVVTAGPSLVPNTPGVAATHTITVTTKSNLAAGISTITLMFTVGGNNARTTSGWTLPPTISRSNIVISGTTCDKTTATNATPDACTNGTEAGKVQTLTADPLIDPLAGTITMTVPDMNPNNQGTVGNHLKVGAVTIAIGAAAGIITPTGASSSSYRVAAWDSTTSSANVLAAKITTHITTGDGNSVAYTVPKVLQLSNSRGARGTAVTVTGLGFSGTTASVFLDNGTGGGTLNNGTKDGTEPFLAEGAAITSGKFTANITAGAGFVNGGDNWIQGMDQAGTTASATRAVATNYVMLGSIVSMAPASGKIGDLVTLTMQDFGDTKACAALSMAGLFAIGAANTGCAPTTGGTAATGTDGTASWSFLVPAGVVQGPNSVSVNFASSSGAASKAFIVNGAAVVATPNTVVAGQQITLSGSGYGGSLTLVNGASNINRVTYDGATIGTAGSPVPPTTVTDSGGGMVMQFKLPKTTAYTAPGLHTITVTDGTISGSVSVTIPSPTLTVNPITGLGGSSITFSGKGWASETSVTVTYPAAAAANNVTATVQSDTSGNILGTMTIPSTSYLAIPSDNTITATVTSLGQSASATHSIPAASITISPISGAPGSSLVVSGKNFPIFQSLTTLTIGGNSVSVLGINTDANGGFTTTILIPGLSQGTSAVITTVGTTTANSSLVITAQPTSVTAVAGLANLVNTQNLSIVTTFDYASGKYQSYVPSLSGNSMTAIAPNTVLFFTLTKDTNVIVSGITFRCLANTPTPIPVGAVLTFTVG